MVTIVKSVEFRVNMTIVTIVTIVTILTIVTIGTIVTIVTIGTSVTIVTSLTRRGHGGHRGGHRLRGGRGPLQVERLHARQVGGGRRGGGIWQCTEKAPVVTVLT